MVLASEEQLPWASHGLGSSLISWGSSSHGKRACRSHSPDQREPGGCRLDRVGLTKARAVGHRKPQPSARTAAACRGRSVRLSCRFRSPSPPLGARSRRGVVLPSVHGASPFVAALRGAGGPVRWLSHLASHPLAQVSHLRCRQRGSVIQSEAVIPSALPALAPRRFFAELFFDPISTIIPPIRIKYMKLKLLLHSYYRVT
jgi:hypothetical protein